MYAAESSADCDATFDAPQMGGFIGTFPRLCGPCGSQYRTIFGPHTAPLTSPKSLLEALFSSACAACCRFYNLRLLGSYQLSTWVVCHNAASFGSCKKGTPNARMISVLVQMFCGGIGPIRLDHSINLERCRTITLQSADCQCPHGHTPDSTGDISHPGVNLGLGPSPITAGDDLFH